MVTFVCPGSARPSSALRGSARPPAARAAWLPRSAAALALLVLSGCQHAYFGALNLRGADGPSNSAVFDARHGLSVDVYRPAETDVAAPVVVFFYGGSWRNGQRDFYRFVGRALAREGVLVLIPDYRKAPRHAFPSFMHDAAAATAWARTNAAGYGGDPERIYLMGHSAGAHIAALLATDARYLAAWRMQPRSLAGVIGLAGPYDFLPITDPGLREVFGDREHWPDSQPVNFVDGNEPPFLLLHGRSDRRVWRANSEALAARLRGQGQRVTLRIIPGTGHIGLVNGFVSPRFSPVLEYTMSWINAGRPEGRGEEGTTAAGGRTAAGATPAAGVR